MGQTIKNIKSIKDFKAVLKDFEPMVKDPKHLWNGRDIKNFKLRPREAWANWLICVVLRKLWGDQITFVEDEVGDGLIWDRKTNKFINTEHVSALEIPKGQKLPTGEQRIIDAINLKVSRGAEYAKNKTLVVFFDGAGSFVRQKIREAVFKKHGFDGIFCVGLLDSGSEGYSYIVTDIRDSYGDKSITFKVEINADFTDWKISQVMA